MPRRFLTAAAVLAMAVPAMAQSYAQDKDAKNTKDAKAETPAKTLTIGDKAPAFEIGHWVKGDAFTEFESDKVYVLEFWATWCGPCVASMEHLSKLQKEYKDYDVTIVGVSDEPLQTVVDFLFKEYKKNGKVQNDRIKYTLTTDPDESVKKDYFTAAGRRGIPCSFIIGKDQKVEWIGHPMQMDEPLSAVVRDTWDRDAFKTKFEKSARAEREMTKRREALMKAHAAEDWDKAIELIDEVLELSGDNTGYQFEKFVILAQHQKKYDAAYALAGDVVKQSWDNAMMLNQVSWFIVDTEGLEKRDLKLAMKAAKRANELTDEKDGAILDTVARVYFEQGDLKTALKYQRKAVKHAEGRMAEELRETLDKYERLADKGL